MREVRVRRLLIMYHKGVDLLGQTNLPNLYLKWVDLLKVRIRVELLLRSLKVEQSNQSKINHHPSLLSRNQRSLVVSPQTIRESLSIPLN